MNIKMTLTVTLIVVMKSGFTDLSPGRSPKLAKVWEFQSRVLAANTSRTSLR